MKSRRRVNSNVMLLPPVKERASARAIIIAVSILTIGALITSACSLLYIDREVSGPVTLNQNWLELTPREPLTIARDTHELALFPDPPIKMVDDPTGQRSL